jgi:hypothetical protein
MEKFDAFFEDSSPEWENIMSECVKKVSWLLSMSYIDFSCIFRIFSKVEGVLEQQEDPDATFCEAIEDFRIERPFSPPIIPRDQRDAQYWWESSEFEKLHTRHPVMPRTYGYGPSDYDCRGCTGEDTWFDDFKDEGAGASQPDQEPIVYNDSEDEEADGTQPDQELLRAMRPTPEEVQRILRTKFVELD